MVLLPGWVLVLAVPIVLKQTLLSRVYPASSTANYTAIASGEKPLDLLFS